MDRVDVSYVEKELKRIPHYILLKLTGWIKHVEEFGIEEVRKIPGFHDEPLSGMRAGQRSIRLNRSYRAIYIVNSQKEIRIIKLIEVNKHEY